MRLHRRLPAALLCVSAVAVTLTSCSNAKNATEAEPGVFAVHAGTISSAPVPDDELDDAVVRMPHMALEVTRHQTSGSITGFDATAFDLGSEEVRAAEGEEFVQATINRITAEYDGGTPSVQLDVGDQSHYLDELATTDSVTVLVSADTDTPVSLTVTDEGKDVSLDLRTGERVGGTGLAVTETYYLPDRHGDLSGEVTSTGSVAFTGDAPVELPLRIDLDSTAADRFPWLPGVGWAEEGSAFLLVHGLSPFWGSNFCSPGGGYRQGAKLVHPGGSVSPISGADAAELGDQAIAFVVPVDFATATLVLNPRPTLVDGCRMTKPMSALRIPIALDAE